VHHQTLWAETTKITHATEQSERRYRMNAPKIDDVFQSFAELLENRLSKGRFTTEDSVRCTFFHCLTACWNIDPSDIILEYPHPRVSGAEVDAYLVPKDKQLGIAFEFKFDRKIPSGRNLPRPQKAGKIFADIFRLARFGTENSVHLFFVYLTDDEMATYMQNPSNQLADFFGMMQGQRLVIDERYVTKHSPTFVNAAGSYVTGCELVCHLNGVFHSGYWIRIYEVKSTSHPRG
jgi:hypothetical protein